MWIHRSNRVESLVDALCELLRAPLADPFEPETIVVQSQGMARYLSMQLSARFAIWANGRFPFPRVLLQEVLDCVAGEATDLLSRDALTLAIAAQLPGRLNEPAFAPLQRYLSTDEGADKLLQLSARLAQVFDDYAAYRDDQVLAWQRGAEPDSFQAELMRALHSAYGDFHMASHLRAFLSALSGAAAPIEGLPERLCVFGVSSLPPLYLRMLSALSTRIPVHLFQLSPTREYWADLRSEREQARLQRRTPTALAHLESGHPLLSSIGRLGREFVAAIDALEAHHDGDDERYVDPGEGCLLHALQSDMLALRTREVPLSIDPQDRSVQVHSAHGPMREVEVLHDQLRGLMRDDPGLRPEHVVVMTPDIELYAPAIEAVFGRSMQAKESRDGRPSLPFRIADRGMLASRPAVEAAYQLLDLLSGRFDAPAVLDALTLPVVARRFSIAPAALDTIRRWVQDSGIRWGVDAAHRAEHGQPELAGNTFVAGLERLLLGYAMEGGGARMFAGRLPYDHVEGSVAEDLGRFASYCRCLFDLRKRLMGERSVTEWQPRLLELLDQALAPDDTESQDLEAFVNALQALSTDASRVGFEAPIGLSAMRRLITGRLDQPRGALGFLSGGITFCQLVPMRSLPFSVVALLGLSDGAFPRGDQPLSFDLRSENPRPTDRTVRDEDRYLFLEAVLSARKALIITYSGRGIHDNGVRPPSVLVSELLDTLDRDYDFATGNARSQLCIEHRLHGFSPAYFCGGALTSFARHNYDAAVALASRPGEAPAFCQGLLPPGDAEMPLPMATRYLEQPVRTFMQQRLDVFVGRDLRALSGREPLELDPLGRWQVGSALLDAVVGDPDPPARLAQLQAPTLAAGALPLGTPGGVSFAELTPVVSALATQAQTHVGSSEEHTHPFAEELGHGVSVAGQLQWRGDTLVSYQFSRRAGRGELALWLQHVIANLLAARGRSPVLPTKSVLLCRGKAGDDVVAVHFEPLAEPEPIAASLGRFLSLAQRAPLPFMRDASRRYVEETQGDKDRRHALARARALAYPEAADPDPYLRIAFPDFGALCDAAPDGFGFSQAAEAVFAPLLSHRSERPVG